jgi:hypothetical protein
MELQYFAQRDPFDGTKALAVLILEKLLSLLRAKALITYNVLRHALSPRGAVFPQTAKLSTQLPIDMSLLRR